MAYTLSGICSTPSGWPPDPLQKIGKEFGHRVCCFFLVAMLVKHSSDGRMMIRVPNERFRMFFVSRHACTILHDLSVKIFKFSNDGAS
jgi:hypothetical protein